MATIEPLGGRGGLGAERALGMPSQVGDFAPPTRVVWLLLAGLALVVGVLALGIITKSAFERRRDRRRAAIETAVRRSFYARLVCDDPDWKAYVADLSPGERRVLIGHVVRATDLVTGAAATQLQVVARALGLRDEALTALESQARHERLWGLKLCIAFGWIPDLERLQVNTSATRTEGEAAIRVLAKDADRLTRVIGVEIAYRYPALSAYGMTALYELVRRDPTPLLERLARHEIEAPALLAQLLRVLVHADPVTDGAPLDGVLACLDHDDPNVRANACLVLARYGWRNDVRDRTDLRLSTLLADPSIRVRISAYHMLGAWGDAAARAKLDRAAEFERNSRARFAIARARHGEGVAGGDAGAAASEAHAAPWAGGPATGDHGWMAPL